MDAWGLAIGKTKPARGFESRDLRECWELAFQQGWRATKVVSRAGKENVEHRCPECA
jgi:hypothetical protein